MRWMVIVAAAGVVAAAPAAAPRSAWDITMRSIDGKPMPLAGYRGRVLLVVNTASFCGFTPQYDGLKALQTRYARQGLTVVGVPSGDFAGQEYEDNARIKQFCETKFGINFPMTEKSSVIGPNAAPFYRWAEAQLGEAATPKWNFHKVLVGRDGRALSAFGSKVAPGSPQLTAAIEGALGTRGQSAARVN